MDIYGSSPLPYWTLTKPGAPCSVERGRLMEGGEQSGTGMEFGQAAVLRKPTPSRPQPNMRGGGAGDMGMSLLSQGFGGGEHESDRSFTHMLAGATSPPSSEDGKGAGAMDTDGMNLGVRALGGGGGSFANRLAARAKDMGDMGGGMGGGGLANHAKLMPPSRIAMPQQMQDFHQLTIPPGLSPGQLLDSPVFCNPQQAEPSPTTGTFPVSYLTDPSKDKTNDQGSTPGFVFKPFAVNVMRNPLSPLSQPALVSHQFAQSQSMQQSHSQAHSGGQSGQHSHMGTSSAPLAVQALNNNSGQNSSMPMAVALSMPSNRQQPERSSESQQTPSPERDSQPAPQIPTYIERPSEDGYNWRKYGQKQVKGSEYPRSYYKCTQANCPMKKKVERSLDGQVTEIVYKGEHNHPKPQPTRRLAVAAAQLISDNSSDRADGDDKWGGFQTHGEYGVKHDRGDDPSSSLRGRVPLGFSLGQNGTPEPSSPSTSEDGSKSMEDGDEEDGPDAKRRKKEKRAFKEQLPPSAPRTIREPRVVVQTTSDVDILDDGYRWRKYGQKVVKGNPHPRSYYKCTNLGCPVRKHVERASNDPKAVITTYEGKHNHDVPVARNSSHDNAGAGANNVSAGSQSGASSVTHSGPLSQQQQGYGRRMSSVFGRLLEDGSKGGDSVGSDVDLGMGVGMGQSMRNMDGSGGSNAANGDLPVSTSITMNVQQSLGHRSGLMSLDSYGGGSSQHDSLRPKQEQDESHHHSGGLQPNNVYHPQRLVLGP